MKDNEEWLKSQCNRYVNGFCSTLRCLKRGGYNRKINILPDNNCATCEPHEILLEIEQLREENESLIFNQKMIG